jgi:hypothetical protein
MSETLGSLEAEANRGCKHALICKRPLRRRLHARRHAAQNTSAHGAQDTCRSNEAHGQHEADAHSFNARRYLRKLVRRGLRVYNEFIEVSGIDCGIGDVARPAVLHQRLVLAPRHPNHADGGVAFDKGSLFLKAR